VEHGVTVKVGPVQIDNVINDVFAVFNERHYDGSFKTYLKYTVSTGDIEQNNLDIDQSVPNTSVRSSFITLPESVMNVNKLVQLSQNSNVFSYEWQAQSASMSDIGRGADSSLNTYLLQQDHLEQLDAIFKRGSLIRYKKESNQWYIDVDWGRDIKEGDVIVIDCVMKTDIAYSSNLLNDVWVKKYAIACIKKQWGMNLIKFEGMQMLGGVTINGRQLFDDAVAEIQILEEALQLAYEAPIDFFMA